jgi:hypothetical protein
MRANRIGENFTFHEELGYWMWDAAERQVMRCFTIPRGVTILAGGTAEANAASFDLVAEVGSETYGIASNIFLDREFKTVRYDLNITVHDQNRFSYAQTSHLKIKNQAAIFHHTDKNTLTRVVR